MERDDPPAREKLLYQLELDVRDHLVELPEAELHMLNERERTITEFLQRHYAPPGAPAPPDSFVPWSPAEHQRFVLCVRQAGADSRSPRELWVQLASGSGAPAAVQKRRPGPRPHSSAVRCMAGCPPYLFCQCSAQGHACTSCGGDDLTHEKVA